MGCGPGVLSKKLVRRIQLHALEKILFRSTKVAHFKSPNYVRQVGVPLVAFSTLSVGALKSN